METSSDKLVSDQFEFKTDDDFIYGRDLVPGVLYVIGSYCEIIISVVENNKTDHVTILCYVSGKGLDNNRLLRSTWWSTKSACFINP